MTPKNDYNQPSCKMLAMEGIEATMLGESDKHNEYSEDDQLAGQGYFEDTDEDMGYRPEKRKSVWDD